MTRTAGDLWPMSRVRGPVGGKLLRGNLQGSGDFCWRQARVLRCHGWDIKNLTRHGGCSDIKGGGNSLWIDLPEFLLKLGHANLARTGWGQGWGLVEKGSKELDWSLVKERLFLNPQIKGKVTCLLLYIKTFCMQKVNLVKEEWIFHYPSDLDFIKWKIKTLLSV